jgi:hypothetical protein
MSFTRWADKTIKDHCYVSSTGGQKLNLAFVSDIEKKVQVKIDYLNFSNTKSS